MAASSEWTEWHLTPVGWVAGSSKIDFLGAKSVEPPEDRAMTCKFSEHMSSIYSELKKESKVVWQSDDRDLVAKLLKQYGECPLEIRARQNG